MACAAVEERAATPDWPAEPAVADGNAVDVTACAGDGDGPTIGEPLPKLNGLAVDPTVNGDGDGALPLLLPIMPLAVELSLKLRLVAARVGLAPLLLPITPLAVELSLKPGLVACDNGADGGTAPCRFACSASSVALLRLRLFCRPVRPP